MASRKRLSKPSSDSAVSTPAGLRAAVAICDAAAGGTPGFDEDLERGREGASFRSASAAPRSG